MSAKNEKLESATELQIDLYRVKDFRWANQLDVMAFQITKDNLNAFIDFAEKRHRNIHVCGNDSSLLFVLSENGLCEYRTRLGDYIVFSPDSCSQGRFGCFDEQLFNQIYEKIDGALVNIDKVAGKVVDKLLEKIDKENHEMPVMPEDIVSSSNEIIRDVMERLDAVNPSETQVHPMYRVQIETYELRPSIRVEAVQICFDAFCSVDAKKVKDWLSRDRAGLFIEVGCLFGNNQLKQGMTVMLKHSAPGQTLFKFTTVADGDYIVRILGEHGIEFIVLSEKQFKLRYNKVQSDIPSIAICSDTKGSKT
jgi:hypothetical protein